MQTRGSSPALNHVPWHPAISLEKYQLGELEAKLGDAARARELLEESVQGLVITHGREHELTKRVAARRDSLAGFTYREVPV